MIRIRKWSETFENAKTRKLIHMSWLNCPSGVDSSGYLSLMSHGEKGIMAFGVFIAICQWSATCRPLIRGSLARSDGKSLTIPQIAMILRMPERAVEDSISLLMRSDINWLENDNGEKPSENPQSATDLPVACQVSATDLPVVPVQGEEGRGVDLDGGPSRKSDSEPNRKMFQIPTVEDVAQYAREKKIDVDPEAFWNFYDSKGWMVGKNKMQKWRSCLAGWASRNKPKKIDRFAHWKLPIEERESLVKQEMYSP